MASTKLLPLLLLTAGGGSGLFWLLGRVVGRTVAVLLTAGVLVLAWIVGGARPWIAIAAAIVAAAGYRLSLKLHPSTTCRRCGGRKHHYGRIYTYAFRDCRSCGGSGRKTRFGARHGLGGAQRM